MKKNIVITGAGRGIGKATALKAASEGNQVFAISRSIESLEGIDNIIPFSVDLSDQEAIGSFCKDFIAKGILVDALINNAGKLENLPFKDTAFDVFETVF